MCLIGGDGLLFQYLQGIYQSKYSEYFRKIPICVLPGGSHNGTACDMHGKIVNHAVNNLLWGTYISRELMRTTDVINQWMYFHIGSLFSGFIVHVIKESNKLRRCFGKYRYIAFILS